MIILNVDLLQRLLGEHWRYIIAGLLVIVGLLIWRAVKNTYSKNDWINEAQKRQQKRHEYTDPAPQPQEPTIYKAQHGQWSPTGWTFNEKNQSWEPPDYISNEIPAKSDGNGWTWNENAKIWVRADQLDSEKHQQAYEAVRRKWLEYYEEQAMLEELRPPKIQLTDEEKETAKRIKIDRTNPTYEEWKAAKLQQKKENPRD